MIECDPFPSAVLEAEDNGFRLMAHFYRTSQSHMIRVRTVNRLATHEVDGVYSRKDAANLYNRLITSGFSEKNHK
jgi:hypothetical protein